ncbi:MAG: DUF1592 domain-containing protein [Alphaproteobacteria bacterium]|nr:DUF1592 domain-containing protein [Alphaproteobacteria bacterium]
MGFEDTHQLEIAIDGERVHLFTLEPTRRVGGEIRENLGSKTIDTRFTIRVPVRAGVRRVSASFLRLPDVDPTDTARVRLERPVYTNVVCNNFPCQLGIYQPHLSSLTIAGPFEAVGGPADTPSRRRVFVCSPSGARDEQACATTITSTLAHRAYRRPVTPADVQPLMRFYGEARAAGESFDSAVEAVIRAVLVSREFLFRFYVDPAGIRAASYRLDDVALASRLSFFLWSSIPDDELLKVAEQGRLRVPAVLETQVRRMLADSKAATLATSFAAQWLDVRALDTAAPAPATFPNFDENLRRALRTEVKLFFDAIVRDDRSVLDFLDADYTFVNERLARHYGIPNVHGSHFRRVSLPVDSPRRGLLGKGAVLVATSRAARTSPVLRGKWIMGTILNSPAPNPPANVPPLEEAQNTGKELSMRERMAAHRSNPVCSSCHSVIDPLGFALENFDPVGAWRPFDQSMTAIDTSGAFPDGASFKTLGEFRTALAANPQRFARGITEKLLTYALSRGLEPSDHPVVRAIVRSASQRQYRFSAIVSEIVQSAPFRMRRATQTVTTSAAR